MFKQAIRGASLPKYLSSDHDPLYRFHQWQANLRILGVVEIKTVPYVPLSHPLIDRLIGTTPRMLGPNAFLDEDRLGAKAECFPGLLQQIIVLTRRSTENRHSKRRNADRSASNPIVGRSIVATV
jgi:hypothetical protein